MRLGLAAVLLTCALPCAAQDRLKTMTGYERAQRVQREGATAVKGGALSATWTDDSAAIEYDRDGKRFRYNIRSATASEAPPGLPPARPPIEGLPDRGRQFS